MIGLKGQQPFSSLEADIIFLIYLRNDGSPLPLFLDLIFSYSLDLEVPIALASLSLQLNHTQDCTMVPSDSPTSLPALNTHFSFLMLRGVSSL